MPKVPAPPTITIKPSSVTELLAHGGALFHDHGVEVEGSPARPHELRYKAMEQHGHLHCLAAWDGSELVGYSVVILSVDLHRDDRTVAEGNAFFVRPDRRSAGVGMKLMRETIALAKAHGAVCLRQHSMPNARMARMLLGMGFNEHHVVYERGLR